MQTKLIRESKKLIHGYQNLIYHLLNIKFNLINQKQRVIIINSHHKWDVLLINLLKHVGKYKKNSLGKKVDIIGYNLGVPISP